MNRLLNFFTCELVEVIKVADKLIYGLLLVKCF